MSDRNTLQALAGGRFLLGLLIASQGRSPRGGADGDAFRCETVVVAKSQSQASINAVNAAAASARTYTLAHDGTPPPGYFVLGDGPVIRPKQ